ncbi:MAG: cobC [Clostridia bacterium]|jgi:alpha-ribazole phosphatase|nr:cobC [Clostridia bacterium]
MITLILIRHATTEANEHQTFSGFKETQISAAGKKQIDALTKRLCHYKIHAIYASPSNRTWQTVKDIADKKRLPIQTADELREIHFGNFEGISFQTIQEEYPDEIIKMIDLGDNYVYPGGESLVQSYKRTAVKIDDIKRIHNEQVILICAHAGTIRNVLSHLISKSPSLHWHFKIDNASLTIVTIENDFAVIERLNDTCFIQDMV